MRLWTLAVDRQHTKRVNITLPNRWAVGVTLHTTTAAATTTTTNTSHDVVVGVVVVVDDVVIDDLIDELSNARLLLCTTDMKLPGDAIMLQRLYADNCRLCMLLHNSSSSNNTLLQQVNQMIVSGCSTVMYLLWKIPLLPLQLLLLKFMNSLVVVGYPLDRYTCSMRFPVTTSLTTAQLWLRYATVDDAVVFVDMLSSVGDTTELMKMLKAVKSNNNSSSNNNCNNNNINKTPWASAYYWAGLCISGCDCNVLNSPPSTCPEYDDKQLQQAIDEEAKRRGDPTCGLLDQPNRLWTYLTSKRTATTTTTTTTAPPPPTTTATTTTPPPTTTTAAAQAAQRNS